MIAFDSYDGTYYIFNIKHRYNTAQLVLHSTIFGLHTPSVYNRNCSFNTKDFASELINDDTNKSI